MLNWNEGAGLSGLLWQRLRWFRNLNATGDICCLQYMQTATFFPIKSFITSNFDRHASPVRPILRCLNNKDKRPTCRAYQHTGGICTQAYLAPQAGGSRRVVCRVVCTMVRIVSRNDFTRSSRRRAQSSCCALAGCPRFSFVCLLRHTVPTVCVSSSLPPLLAFSRLSPLSSFFPPTPLSLPYVSQSAG